MRHGSTTCLTIGGQVDGSNRDRFGDALGAVDLTATTRVELDLAELVSCDVDAGFELAVFATQVRDRGGQVAVVRATPWVLTLLTLADVADAVAMPPLDSSAPASPRATSDVSPAQALALRWLLGVLDADGIGPLPVQVSDSLPVGDDSPAAATIV